MIPVSQAHQIFKENSITLLPQKKLLSEALHLVSAEDIFAPIDVPSFDNSAMDGYVFRFEDVQNQKNITVNHEIQAGTSALFPLKPYEAARIFTGAPIPENGDTVVPQEDVEVENGILKFQKKVLQNANIRKKGSQTQKGTLILKKNTKFTAEYLGFLATLGIAELLVYPKPKVGILVTGKELVPLGKTLENHQIYESNSIFLKAALQEIGIEPVFSIWVDDDKNALKNVIQDKNHSVDVLLITGGISVGDYDFVKPVLDELQTKEHFYKIKQKPGKPLFFGTLETTSVVALPGNPSAVVTCFHAYVKPFLKAKMGFNACEKKEYGILLTPYSKKAGLTHFVKAVVKDRKVEILNNQLSYQMDAYSKANALAVLQENQEEFGVGEKVEIIPFR